MALASPQEQDLSASGIDHHELTAATSAPQEQEQQDQGAQSGQFLVKWTLKILSGVHLGAEIPLYQGSTRLGKGEDNDIVLSGDNLPERLFTLVCSGNEVFVEDLTAEQDNYLAGKLLSGQKAGFDKSHVSPFEVITSGGLHLVYGPKDETWPEVAIPELEAEGEQIETEQIPAADSKEQSPESAPEQTQLKAGTEQQLIKQHLAVLILISVLAFGTIAFYLGFSSQEENLSPPLSAKEQYLKAEQALQGKLIAAGLDKLEVKQGNNQVLTIEGFVSDHKQQQQVQQLIKEFIYPVKTNIRVLSQLFNNLSYLLKVLGYPDLKVAYAEQAGDFVIGGYLADKSHWASLKGKLARDVAGVGDISGNFDTQASRAAWLKSRLSQAGLDNLALAKKAAALVVSGEIAAGSLASWQQIELEFNQKYQGLPTLKFSAQRIEKTIQEIKGVSLGAVPYIITAGGKRVITGGKLAGGYLIESIGPDRVVLSKAGKAMIYLIGGQHNE